MPVSSNGGVCVPFTLSFHIMQLNGEKNLEHLGESKGARSPGAPNYSMDQNHHIDLHGASCE